MFQSKNVINVNPNQCPTCEYVASNLQDFENHQKIHHLKRRFFRCAKCSYMTHVRARYTKHVKYHSMPMIKCNSCDFRTPYKVCFIINTNIVKFKHHRSYIGIIHII